MRRMPRPRRLLSRRVRPVAPPGVSGPARVGRASADVVARLEPGDVAVLDHLDLDRRTARALLAGGVVAVVNASPSTSGRYPNLGPDTLVAAGVTLVDGVGADVLRRVRDGARVRVHEDAVYVGDEAVATGTHQTAETVAAARDAARSGLESQLGALVGDAAARLERDHDLLLDGEGLPVLATELRHRAVLVVADDDEATAQLRRLRPWVREHRPVVLAVGGGADRALALRLVPHVVLGDLDTLSERVLSCGAETVALVRPGAAAVVVDDAPAVSVRRATPRTATSRADAPGAASAVGGAGTAVTDAVVAAAASAVPGPRVGEGRPPGAGRARARGVEPHALTADVRPEDAALLLAHAHDPWAVVVTGPREGLVELLDRGRDEASSALLTRLAVGADVVHADTVAGTHRPRIPAATLLLLVVAAALVVVAAVVVSPLGHLTAADAVSTVASLLTEIRGALP